MAGIFSRQLFKRATLTFSLLGVSCGVCAGEKSYPINPIEVAKNTYFIEGARENFSTENGGAIANVAFINAGNHILVIDSGPSKRYGDQLFRLIKNQFGRPATDLLISHHHPDHALGTQAFAGISVWALPRTTELLRTEGGSFAENLYQLVGDWMRDTEISLPNREAKAGPLFPDTDRFELIALRGHTSSDLLLMDHQTRTLFTSDIVFYQRALATPHTPGLAVWRQDIERLKALDFDLLVPGHGPAVAKDIALAQMTDYLNWLNKLLSESATQGLTMNEVIRQPIPDRFSDIAMSRYELTRTVTHLYPTYEETLFSAK